MFQRGTGERFKYKAEVLKHFPDAKCKAHNVLGIKFYTIKINNRETSRKSAEGAWSACWIKYIKPNPDEPKS